MANTKFDSKSFNPQAFAYAVDHIPSTHINALVKSRALVGNPDIRNAFTDEGGTMYARIALKGLLEGKALNYDGVVNNDPVTTKTYEQGVIVAGRMKAWKEKDFAYDITGGEDFMQNVAVQLSEYFETVDQNTILAELAGAFASTDTGSASFVKNHTTYVDGELGAGSINSAMQKACGAKKSKFSMAIMHSVVATNLENLNLLQYLKYTDANGIQRDLALATVNGRMVLVDDYMPAVDGYFDAAAGDAGALKIVTGTAQAGEIKLSDVKPYYGENTLKADMYVVKATGYTTYILGDGAIFYENLPVKTPYHMDYDGKEAGGVDVLYSKQRKCFAPYGLSYEKTNQTSNSPTDEELADGTNWCVVHSGEAQVNQRTYLDHRNIPIARIISKG